MNVGRIFLFLFFLGSVLLSPRHAVAGDPEPEAQSQVQPEAQNPMRETLEVKRADHKKRKHQSLRWLRDNRAFLRAQFDQLRLEIGYERDGRAQIIDDQLLLLQQLSSEIASASDVIHDETERARQRELLMGIDELAELEAQLDLFEHLLIDQQLRLLTLENDFLGRQGTALVVVVRGLPSSGAPTALLLQEEDTTLRIDLSPAQGEALQDGGVAQIYHEFVEPRSHRLELRLEGAGWENAIPTFIDVETPRDQLTFLELDLAALDPQDPEARPGSQVWQR